MRTTTRTFARDVNKAKTLVLVTEEEERTLPSGDSSVVRITSSPDTNGRLQITERETVQTQQIGEHVEESQSTIALPSINGGLAPAVRTDEIRKRGANDTVECKKATLLLDGGGNWQVNEIRQTTSGREGDSRISEERVSRPDGEGKLREVSRVVSKASENSFGEKHNKVETYSIDVPGTPEDGSLHLLERTTVTQRSGSTGEQLTERQVEKINPGDPSSGPRVSVFFGDRVQSAPSGEQATRTIRVRDASGSFEVVSVETKKTDRTHPVQLQQTPAQQSK